MTRTAATTFTLLLALGGFLAGCSSGGSQPSTNDTQAQGSHEVPAQVPATAEEAAQGGSSGEQEAGEQCEGESGGGGSSGEETGGEESEGETEAGSSGSGQAGSLEGDGTGHEQAPAGSAPSHEEKRSSLDSKLAEALSEFDRKMEQEQRALATERQDPAFSRPSGQAGQSSFRGEESGGLSSAEGDTGEEASGGAAGRQGQGETGDDDRVPADVSDGADDDIVARQLREAALAEDDPELRAKLWEEYRKYKSGRESSDGDS